MEHKFPDIECHEHIVMPNHFHAILINNGSAAVTNVPTNVGANLCVRPNPDFQSGSGWGEHIGSPLHRVVQWFKTMSTNEYIRGVKHLGWQPFPGKFWQRNYYEHIIRNDVSYNRISDYISNNPSNWDNDSLKA